MQMYQNAKEEERMELRRGPWTIEEDFALIDYITRHGEGHWNSLARCAGLKRTGKSCRLRWLNYLRPDVRRGNITLEEQLLILQLHCRWGNKWSKIAQHLPGRTDNEIKNYWRTRVQKHVKLLKCDVNSKQFKDTMRCIWIPRLVEKIQASTTARCHGETTVVAATTHQNVTNLDSGLAQIASSQPHVGGTGPHMYASQCSSISMSPESFGTLISNVTDLSNNETVNQGNNNKDCYDHCYSDLSPIDHFNQGLGFAYQNSIWDDGGDMWFVDHQFNYI